MFLTFLLNSYEPFISPLRRCEFCDIDMKQRVVILSYSTHKDPHPVVLRFSFAVRSLAEGAETAACRAVLGVYRQCLRIEHPCVFPLPAI